MLDLKQSRVVLNAHGKTYSTVVRVIGSRQVQLYGPTLAQYYKDTEIVPGCHLMVALLPTWKIVVREYKTNGLPNQLNEPDRTSPRCLLIATSEAPDFQVSHYIFDYVSSS